MVWHTPLLSDLLIPDLPNLGKQTTNKQNGMARNNDFFYGIYII